MIGKKLTLEKENEVKSGSMDTFKLFKGSTGIFQIPKWRKSII